MTRSKRPPNPPNSRSKDTRRQQAQCAHEWLVTTDVRDDGYRYRVLECPKCHAVRWTKAVVRNWS